MTEEERHPPERVRVTKLQEAQLTELHHIDGHAVFMYYNLGVSQEQLKQRSEAEIGYLTRNHDVLVAEADHEPAGYLAWADQAPGVAYIEWIAVHPDYQRFGIATRLLREVGEAAAEHGIKAVVVPILPVAPWAVSFLASRGFKPAEGEMPAQVGKWLDEHQVEVVGSGRQLWWAPTDGLGTIPGLPRPS